jgi:hypothetical protein
MLKINCPYCHAPQDIGIQAIGNSYACGECGRTYKVFIAVTTDGAKPIKNMEFSRYIVEDNNGGAVAYSTDVLLGNTTNQDKYTTRILGFVRRAQMADKSLVFKAYDFNEYFDEDAGEFVDNNTLLKVIRDYEDAVKFLAERHNAALPDNFNKQ